MALRAAGETELIIYTYQYLCTVSPARFLHLAGQLGPSLLHAQPMTEMHDMYSTTTRANNKPARQCHNDKKMNGGGGGDGDDGEDASSPSANAGEEAGLAFCMLNDL